MLHFILIYVGVCVGLSLVGLVIKEAIRAAKEND